jgi:hypothetical protein
LAYGGGRGHRTVMLVEVTKLIARRLAHSRGSPLRQSAPFPPSSGSSA